VPRWAAFAGLGFAALFAAGPAVYGSGAGNKPAEITADYASHSDRMRQLAGFALIVPAAVLLAVLAAGAASRLDAPGRRRGRRRRARLPDRAGHPSDPRERGLRALRQRAC